MPRTHRLARAAARPGAVRPGFSLLEITLVVLIIGVLMGIATVAFAPRLLQAKGQATEATMVQIKQALETYRGQHNQYPSNLSALTPDLLEGPLVDGWDNPFWYAVPGQGGRPYDLISAGDDGDHGTMEDNIDVWSMDQQDRGG